jgi:hypothetical protein
LFANDFDQMNSVIANLNHMTKRAALPMCVAWRRNGVIKMTLAVGD